MDVSFHVWFSFIDATAEMKHNHKEKTGKRSPSFHLVWIGQMSQISAFLLKLVIVNQQTFKA